MTDELQAAEVETYRVALAEGHSLLFHVCAEKCPVADSLVAYMDAVRATEAARYRRLVEAIETEHEEWHRQYDGTSNGFAPPIAQCRNGLCAALAENPAPAALPDEAMVELVARTLANHWMWAEAWESSMGEVAREPYRALARTVLAVITEPVDGNSTVRG